MNALSRFFTDIDYEEVVDLACSEFNIKLENVPKCWDKRENRSYVSGNEIFLGDYEDEELKAISFFHEIGHILVTQKFKEETDYNTLMIELEAWNFGVGYALKHGLLFSDKALSWGYKQALTYVGHDERERMNWKFQKRIAK